MNLTQKQAVLAVEPTAVLELTKEGLVELYRQTNLVIEDLEAQVKVIRDELMAKIKGAGEVIGDFACTKVRRLNWTISLDQARELGAVKEAIDTIVLKKAHDKGVEIPHTVTEFLTIKEIKKNPEKKVIYK